MKLFEILGLVKVDNTTANNSLDETNAKADKVAKELQQKFETVGNAFSKVGEGMTKAGTVLTSTLTLGIGGLATAGLKYNMEMENFQMNLTTLLGSSDKATKLLNDLQNMAATTPFETTDLISATETMIGFGISAQDSQKYLSMIGDIAMGDANKLSGLSLAFSQVQSTGKLTGQDLLQMINQGFNPLKYISEQTGESMASLKERMSEGGISAKEVAGAFEYATSKGQPFYQGMENGAKTVSGRISTLKDNFMILTGKLTEGLLPVFEKVVNKAIELTEKFSNMDKEQRNQILKWAGIVAAIGPVLMIFGKLVSGFGSIISIIGKVKGAGGIAGLITKFGGLAAAVGPTIGIIAGVVAAIGILVHVLGGPKEALEKLKNAFEKVKEVITTFLERIDFKDKLEEIKEKFGGLGDKLKGLGDLFKVIGSVAGAILVPTLAVLSGAFNGVLVIIGPLIDIVGGVIDILAGLGSFIVGIFTGDLEKAGKAVEKIIKGIESVFGGLWDAVVGFLVGFVEGVIEFFVSLWDTLVGHSIVPDTINSIIDWFKELLGKPLEFVKNMKDKVVNFFGDLKDKAVNKAKDLYNGAKEKFSSMKTAVVDKAKELKDGAVNKFNELKDKASEKVTSFKNRVVDGFKTLTTNPKQAVENMKTNVTNAFQKMNDASGGKLGNLVNSVKNKFDSVKNNISNKMTSAKNKVSDIFQSMNSATGGKLGSLVSTVSSKFTSVYNKVKEKMNSAKEKVTSIISSMTSAFKKFAPKLKMPHIKITGDWDLKKLKFPKFSVDWYDKAMDSGMILNEPTIFGINNKGQFMGGGETGSETIVGTNSLMGMIQQSVYSQNLGLASEIRAIRELLAEILPLLLNRQLCLDSGELVGALVGPMDKALGDKSKDKRRGR